MLALGALVKMTESEAFFGYEFSQWIKPGKSAQSQGMHGLEPSLAQAA